ncbi:MAG: hypothetical protein ACYTG0_13790 [Planctomycetota bacterium]
MKKKQVRPASLYLLMAALLFQGLSGVAGGFGLVTDPTGSAVGIPVNWLRGSPFSDYLVPGLILLLVLGVFPLLVVYGLWMQHPWSWRAALLVGLALIVWIVVEILIVGYHSRPPLQLIYGLLGLVILVLVLLPALRRCLGGKNKPHNSKTLPPRCRVISYLSSESKESTVLDTSVRAIV